MIRRWSDYIDTGKMPVYSESFKRRVVAEVESGLITKEEARRKYNIRGKTTVLQWCRKFAKLSCGKINMEALMPDSDMLLRENELLRKENCQLRKSLEDAQLKAFALEKLIEVAEAKLGVEIKKKLE